MNLFHLTLEFLGNKEGANSSTSNKEYDYWAQSWNFHECFLGNSSLKFWNNVRLEREEEGGCLYSPYLCGYSSDNWSQGVKQKDWPPVPSKRIFFSWGVQVFLYTATCLFYHSIGKSILPHLLKALLLGWRCSNGNSLHFGMELNSTDNGNKQEL